MAAVALPHVVGALKGKDGNVRLIAVKALGTLAGNSPALAAEALPHVAGALGHWRNDVRRSAV